MFQKGTLLRHKKSCIKSTTLENDLQGLFGKKTNLEKMGIFLPKWWTNPLEKTHFDDFQKWTFLWPKKSFF